jgi:hypothetical protein
MIIFEILAIGLFTLGLALMVWGFAGAIDEAWPRRRE